MSNSQSKALEREVLQDARKTKDNFTWPTILLLIGLYAGYATALHGAINGYLPLWATFLINAFIAYAAYTPLHEAVHDNVAKGKWRGLTPIVGTLSSWLFMHNYALQRVTHLSHHVHLNDPSKDADHWVAGKNPLDVLWRCATLAFAHYVMGTRIANGRTRLRALIENAVPVAWFVFVGITFGWNIAMFGILLPALMGVTLLGLFFDYLVHAPYAATVAERYTNTRAYVFKGVAGKIAPIPWSGQNYHLMHHLYPWVPFYRYREAFDRAQVLLNVKKSPVIRIGA